MTAYYNEIDPAAAQWLRNLIEAGHIAPGIVDERSIEDVYPSDLRGFTLRSSGWSDDRPVWTGSCPCQPFSAAGKGAGFDDERHLWPAFQHLIKECKPAIVVGEQSAHAAEWIVLVRGDMEALGYAVGAMPFEAASAGAFHLRDRLYFVANAIGAGLEERERIPSVLRQVGSPSEGKDASDAASTVFAWFIGSDGKRRPFEPRVHPMANDTSARVVRLRAYGNAINSLAAQTFIQSVMEAE